MKKSASRITAPQLWWVMARSHHALTLLAEQSITSAGLCLTDFAALEALLHKGPLTITQIQDKVLLASGSMTAAIDRLEKRGLVVRKSTSSDRRARMVELTHEGKRVAAAYFEKHARDLEALLSVLSPKKQRQLHPHPSRNLDCAQRRNWMVRAGPYKNRNVIEDTGHEIK